MSPDERLARLRTAEAGGATIAPILFWNADLEPDGRVGAGCLSQWWPAPFTIEDVRYATAEHWMMAAKARLFADDEALARILASDDPAAAKRAGREVRGFDSPRWEVVRYAEVVTGNRAKFGQHEDLDRVLLGTGDRVLAEASPVDRVWGIGLAADHPDAASPTAWTGRNLLGFALMAVRDGLRRRLAGGG